ncbi:MAG: hypothetical protein R3E86_19830 [Pseudomonadales bacterium]
MLPFLIFSDAAPHRCRRRRLRPAAWTLLLLGLVAVCAQAEESLGDILGEVADPLDQVESQIQVQEYGPAINWLESYIDEVERATHRYAPELVRPLTLLGDAYAGQGDYVTALENYERAVHLSRVNNGLNEPGQIPIVYREADAYRRLGDYRQANDREEYAYHVLTSNHDATDEALLPGIYHLASWYVRTANVFAARALYEQALAILSSAGKYDTPAAIPALRGLAATHRMEWFPPYYEATVQQTGAMSGAAAMQPVTLGNAPEGERALQQVVQIQKGRADPDPMAEAEAVLELADWYAIFDKWRRARPLYEYAYQIIASIPELDATGYFAEPRLLYFPAPTNPSPPPLEQRGEQQIGFVEVHYGISDTGVVRDMTTVASEPAGLMDFRVRKSLREARYRPILVDGVPVETSEHVYRHEFPYYPKREDAPVAAVAEATDEDTDR